MNNKERHNNVQNQPSPSQNKQQSGLVWIVLTGIIGILIGAILSSQIGNDTQDVAIAPTETVVPTEVPATEIPATATAVPTVPPTEVPATETAIPTNTASPSPVPTQTTIPTPTMIAIDKKAIISKVQSSFELVSAKAVVQVDINYTDRNYILVTKSKYTVLAGIDLNDITEKNIIVTRNGEYNTVTITLPPTKFIGNPAEVPNSTLIQDKIALTWSERWEQYWGNKSLEIPVANKINSEHQAEALKRACEFGLLEFAADHARAELRSFLFDSDPLNKYNDYIIKAPVGTCESN